MKKTALIIAIFLAPLTLGAQQLRILVGTYTEDTPAEGVYLYTFDAETADAQLIGMAPSGNPSFVVSSADGKLAYAVNEYNDGRQGVSSFALNADGIVPLNSIPIPKDQVSGEDPCNILITGEAIITSNYTGGSVTVFPIGKDGCLEEMSRSFEAASSHMHCAVKSPDGKYIFVADLGNDCIRRFDCGDGTSPLGNHTVAWKKCGPVRYGPRHMVFSSDGRFAYMLCELGDRLIVFSYADGSLVPVQDLRAYNGRGHGSADIHLSPDGRFLYTSHRLRKDGISSFSVDISSGKVKRAGYRPTGRHPRNFAISPDGRYLLCACRDDDRIEIYSIDKTRGTLMPAGKSIHVGAPVCIQFLQ